MKFKKAIYEYFLCLRGTKKERKGKKLVDIQQNKGEVKGERERSEEQIEDKPFTFS